MQNMPCYRGGIKPSDNTPKRVQMIIGEVTRRALSRHETEE